MSAVKAKDHYSFDELMACAKGEMFGPGNAQLPTDRMLMLDRIARVDARLNTLVPKNREPELGGELIDLDCSSVFWAFGAKLSFMNLCDHAQCLCCLHADEPDFGIFISFRVK